MPTDEAVAEIRYSLWGEELQPETRGAAIRQQHEHETRGWYHQTGECRRCGTSFVIHGTQVYCSRECSREVRNDRRRATNALLSRTCAHCGTDFEPARSDARYCSTRCRVAAHRARHDALEECQHP